MKQLRVFMAQLKVSHAATKTQHHQINKYFQKNCTNVHILVLILAYSNFELLALGEERYMGFYVLLLQLPVRNGNPLQYSCLENPMDREAWQATVHGVAESWTRLSDFTSSLTT